MVMALDLGDTRTGVAFSDLTEMLGSRAYSVTEYNKDKLLEKVLEIIRQEKPRVVVVGLPTNMNGTEGDRAAGARLFAQRLKESAGCEIALWDERMTSVMANRILSDAGKKRGKQRARVDAVAASLILQSYLDASLPR
ncbi:Holliday junction resolvase RuvX [Acidaminobacterium chupaoyuni]